MDDRWTDTPLDALIRHIIDTHHAYIRGALPVLARLVSELISSRREPAHAEAFERLRRIFQYFERDLRNHIEKEETTLFPLIARMQAAASSGDPVPRPSYGSIRHPIGVLEEEHQAADQEMQMMREMLATRLHPMAVNPAYGELVARLDALDADLQVHVHLEDDVLFPRACAMEH